MADPGGVGQDPTFKKKKPYSDATLRIHPDQTRIRIRYPVPEAREGEGGRDHPPRIDQELSVGCNVLRANEKNVFTDVSRASAISFLVSWCGRMGRDEILKKERKGKESRMNKEMEKKSEEKR